jgi:hypothetical protein
VGDDENHCAVCTWDARADLDVHHAVTRRPLVSR